MTHPSAVPNLRHQADRPASDLGPGQNGHAPVIFTGIQPTGTPHLGNYLGFIQPFLELQRTSTPSTPIYLCIAGLHAISIYRDPDQLRHDRRDILAVLIAAGVDPERTCLYFQEDVPEHAELAWALNAVCPVSRLMAMSSWKNQLATRSATSVESITEADLRLGLLAYPVLQAADILLYKSTLVPVGDDQSPHMELTSFITDTFNASHRPIFPVPKPVVVPSSRVLNLQDPKAKMSKSHPSPLSRIYITDSPADIHTKIHAAITEPPVGDTEHEITYDPVLRPGLSNLLLIWSALDEASRSAAELADFAVTAGWTVAQLKERVASALITKLGPVRDEYERIREDHAYLRRVAEKGRTIARAKARGTMEEVRAVLGLDAI